jgi:hypothetical protein
MFNIFKCFSNKNKKKICDNKDELNKTYYNGILVGTEIENKQHDKEFCINLFNFCYHSNFDFCYQSNNNSKRIDFNSDYILE